MRHHPICWSRTLAKLGFRRRVRKAKPQWFRSMRMEPLETRQMLSTSQLPEAEFDDPIIIVSGPAAPTSESQLSSTSVTDVYGTQGVVLPRQSYVLLSQKRADGSTSDQFVVRTEYDATGAPRAIVSLRPGVAEIDDSLHTLQLELRIDETKLGEIELLIDVESQAFRQQFLADRLERASQEVSPVEAAQLQSWMSALDAQGEFADLQGMEPELAEQASLERLNGVAKGVGREGMLPFSDQARLGVYMALRNSAQAAKTEEQAALTAEEKEAAAADARQVGRATLLLSDRIAADLQSTDEQVNQAAQALRDELLASGELYYTLFTGLRRNQEVIRSISGNAERVLAFVEEGSINLTPQLRVELGDQQAMVEGTIVQGVGFSSAALTADVAGDRYVAANSQEVIYNDRLSVRRTGGDNTIVSLLSVDLSSHQGKLPTQATLTLKTLDGQPSANHKISAHYQTWNDPTTPFDESTYSWSQYLGISSGFREWAGNTWNVASGSNVIDITIAAQRALLVGDSNVDGAVTVAGAYGAALGDIEAFYQAVRHWDAYAAQYGDVQQVVDDLLYRNDANWDGQVTTADIAAFFSRLNTGRGNYTLDNVTDLFTNVNTTGADYSRWSQNYGRVATRFSQGDGNFDGWVNDADLSVWQGSVSETHAAPTTPRLLLRIEETQPNQTLVNYGSKENPDSSRRPVVDLTYGIAEASISSFIGTDTTTSNGGMLRVQYRMPEGTPSGARSLSAYQVRQTPSGPVETLLATSGVLSGSPTEWSFNPTTITDPTSDYTIVARLSVGGVVVSERELSGGIFKDTGNNWHLLGGEGKDSVTINTDSMSITGDLNVNIKSTSMPTSRRSFYVRTGAGYDTVGFSPAWVQSAWFSGGDQNDAFTVAGPIQQNTSLQIKDDSGLDRLDFSAAFGFQFSNFNLASATPQDIVVNSQTAKLTLTLLDTPLELITGVPASYLSGPGYNGAPLIVDTLADLPVGLGVPDDMGLRKALAVADAISGSNSIEFATSLFSGGGQQKLRLQDIGGGTSTPDTLLVASAVTITGPGVGALAISGEDLTRIMQVNSGVVATINDLTFLDGRLTGTNRGAGVLNNGTLTLNRVVFDSNESSNHGAAVSTSATGTLKVTDSTFVGNKTVGGSGGAIYSGSNLANALVIERSTFIGNEANSAGALYLDGSDETGTASIVNSTFSGNKALAGQGGAIRNTSSAPPLTIVNSTIVANTATSSGGALAIAGNTANRFLIHNTIVADNVSTTTTTENISGNAKVGSSYNLVGFGGTGSMTAVNSNILLASGASPGLGSLGWHGGPTQTYSLTPTSVAIDAGANAQAPRDSFGTLLEGDQRGVNYTRFYNDPSEPNVNGDETVVDIGAFEYFGQFQWREAERPTLLTPPSGSAPRLEVVGDLTASGSRLLSVFNTGDSTVASAPTAATASIAKYDFTVEKTGDFRLWMRVVAPNEGANSLWWRVNGGGWTEWQPTPGPGWRWLTVVSGINLAAGPTHTLELASGEDGIQLDKFLWTDNVNPYSAQPELLGGVDSLAVRPVIELPATVRDFHAAAWIPTFGSTTQPHPDFQSYAGTTETPGLVFNGLSLAGPEYNASPPGLPNGPQLNGMAAFAQWFNDASGVNRSAQVTAHIIEDSTRAGVFQFVGTTGAAGNQDLVATTHEFFPADAAMFAGSSGSPNYEPPIDDQDGGSGDRDADEVSEDHNYGFSLELHAEFTFHANQLISILKASDDLWIFIDGRLFVDLGGVHDEVGQQKSLNNFGLIEGRKYTFDLFYANRSVDDSLLAFETTIPDLKGRSPIQLVEEQRFVTHIERPVILASTTKSLQFKFTDLIFDTTDQSSIRDAFEIAILDPTGTPVVPTIGVGRDSFFNITDGVAPKLAPGVTYDVMTGVVSLDVSHLTSSGPFTWTVRLINNDGLPASDTESTVRFDMAVGQSVTPVSNSNAAPLAPNKTSSSLIDFNRLSDVSESFAVNYANTAYNESTSVLTVAGTLSNKGKYSVRGPILLGFKGFTRASTSFADFDGVTPDGVPYIDVTDAVLDGTDGRFEPTAISGEFILRFLNKRPINSGQDWRFDYDVVVLALRNDAPEFTNEPVFTFPDQRVIEVPVGKEFIYDADATDANDDDYYFKFAAKPATMVFQHPTTGPAGAIISTDGKIRWNTTGFPIGSEHAVRLIVTDEHGAASEQEFSIRVVASTPNRQPYFENAAAAVVDAYVGQPYVFGAIGFDPDFDAPLYYELGSLSLNGVPQSTIPGEPGRGLSIDGDGRVTWTPLDSQVDGTFEVELLVHDRPSASDPTRRTGRLLYKITVHQANRDPYFTSEPFPDYGPSNNTVEHLIPPRVGPGSSSGPVNPQIINLSLAPDEVSLQSVYINIPDSALSADVVFVVDSSSSHYVEKEFLADGPFIDQISAALQAQGIDARFGVTLYTSSADIADVGPADADPKFGTASQVRDAIDVGHVGSAFFSDGFMALHEALTTYDFRPNAAKVFVMITDVGRELYLYDNDVSTTDDFGDILAELQAENATLHVLDYLGAHEVPGSDPNTSLFAEELGVWTSSENDYYSSSSLISAATFLLPPRINGESRFQVDLTISDEGANHNGYFIYDFVNAQNFKFIGVSANLNRYERGHVSGTNWVIDAFSPLPIDVEIDATYSLEMKVSDFTATVKLLHSGVTTSFSGVGDNPLSNMRVGLSTQGSVTKFDNFIYNEGSNQAPLTNLTENFDGATAIGIRKYDGTMAAYVAQGDGGFTILPGGEYTGDPNSEATDNEYGRLAMESLGARWDYTLVNHNRQFNNFAESMANGFASAVFEQAMRPLVRLDADDEALVRDGRLPRLVGSTNLGGPLQSVEFEIGLRGDGSAHTFDLRFENDTAILGSIPISIGAAYQYELSAADPDNDRPLTFAWAPGGQPAGAILTNNIVSYTPPATLDLSQNVRFKVIVSDGAGGRAEQEWFLDVDEFGTGNLAPVVVPLNKTIQAGQSISIQVEASDVLDSFDDRLQYFLLPGADAVPDGLEIDRYSGEITWSPKAAHVTGQQTGSNSQGLADGYDLVVRVRDGLTGVKDASLKLYVRPQHFGNSKPIFDDVPAQLVQVLPGDLFKFTALANDVDLDRLTYSIVGPPGIAVGNVDNKGEIRWDTTGFVGTFPVQLIVRDGKNGSDFYSFQIEVGEPNEKPVFVTQSLPHAQIGVPYETNIVAIDPEGTNLVYFETAGFPATLELDYATGRLAGQITSTVTFDVLVRDQNGAGATRTKTFTLIADPATANTAPSLDSLPRAEVGIGQELIYRIEVSDAQQNPVTVQTIGVSSAVPIDAATYTPATKILRWIANPAKVKPGDIINVNVTISDGTISVPYSIPVLITGNYVNDQPQIDDAIFPAAVVGREYRFKLSAFDPNDDVLAWRLAERSDSQMVIDPVTGEFIWTPDERDLPSQEAMIEVIDNYGGSDTVRVTIPVRGNNTLPQFTNFNPPRTAKTSSTSFNYQVETFDVDAGPQTVRYSLQGLAGQTWLKIDSLTGLITANGAFPATAGDHEFEVRISDVNNFTTPGAYASTKFTLRLANDPSITNRPPDFGPIEVFDAYQGQTDWELIVTVTDPEGNGRNVTIDAGSLANGFSAPQSIGGDKYRITWNTAGKTAGQNYALTINAADTGTGASGLTSVLSTSVFLSTLNHNAAPYFIPPLVGNRSITQGQVFKTRVSAVDPDASNARLRYELLNPPTGVTIDEFGVISWNSPVAGSHNIVVQVRDDFGKSAAVPQSFQLVVAADTTGPQVTVKASGTLAAIGSEVLFAAFATDNVQVADVRLRVTKNPLGTPETFYVPLTGIYGRHVFSQAATYRIDAIAKDVNGNVSTSAPIDIVIFDPALVLDPEASLSGIVENEEITKNKTFTYQVAFPGANPVEKYRLELINLTTGLSQTLAEGDGDVSPGTGSAIPATATPNGVYTLRLSAFNGLYSDIVERTVIIDTGAVKIGNFSLSFTDLSIPVGGIPLTISRTYDTIQADRDSEFGFGWRLNFRQAELSTTNTIDVGEALFGNNYPAFTMPAGGTAGTTVYISLPGGEKHVFEFEPELVPNIVGTLASGTPLFKAIKGTTSTLTVPHASLSVFEGVLHAGSGNSYSPYNPARKDLGNVYYLTTQQGVTYEIDATTGEINAITDPLRRRLELSDAAATTRDSQGKILAQVTFTRQNGRITEIHDPENQAILYGYDPASGNLTSVTDRSGRSTEYRYNVNGQDAPILQSRPHFLTTILDDRGVRVMQATFDESTGRLSGLTDASGNSAGFSYSLDAQQTTGNPNLAGHTIESVTDASDDPATPTINESVPTNLLRDARGNIVRRITRVSDKGTSTNPYDDLWQVATFFYDANNFQIGVGKSFQIDENLHGANARYTKYAGGSSTAPIVDPDAPGFVASQWENVQRFDDRGNVLVRVDSAGNRARYEQYDEFGNPGVTIDPTGTVSVNSYEGGLLKRTVIDVLNGQDSVVDYSYDQYGNVKSFTRTLDDKGTSRLDDDITVSAGEFNYNDSGLVESSTGSQTTDHPEGVTSYFRYDGNGNRTLSFSYWDDPAVSGARNVLVVSRVDFDGDGRAIKSSQYTFKALTTSYPALIDPAALSIDLLDQPLYASQRDWQTETIYDAAGRVWKSIDRFGNVSENRFDKRGNVVESRTVAKMAGTTPVLWFATRAAYDANGQVVAATDPFLINASGQYVDPISELPFTGGGVPSFLRVTHTIYDDLGRVLETRRLSGLEIGVSVNTTYEEDIYETTFNANYELTGWHHKLLERSTVEYDSAGRVFKSTIYNTAHATNPFGAVLVQTFYQYDSAGRQLATVETFDMDGNGSIVANDLTGPVGAPDGIPDAGEFARTESLYDASGRQNGTIDALGRATEFAYDGLGRLYKTIADVGGLNVTTETKYDALGRRIAEIDALGQQTEYGYDEAGRLTSVKLPKLVVPATGATFGTPLFKYRYDVYGNQIEIEDPLGRITRFAYDHAGRQTKRTLPIGVSSGVGFTELKSYSDASLAEIDASLEEFNQSVGLGQLEYVVDFEGRVTAFRYDNTATGGGRLVGKFYYDALSSYNSDKLDGNLNAAAESMLYAYDAIGRVKAVTFYRGPGAGNTDVTTTTYDADGRTTSIDSPEGTIRYEYDNLGRLKRTYTGGFDNNGTTNPGEEVSDTRYTYDSLGRLKTVTVRERKDTTFSTEAPTVYAYDKVGNLDQITHSNGVISDYVYDDLNRLVDLIQYKETNSTPGYQDGPTADKLFGRYEYTVRADGKRTRVIETDDASRVTQIDWLYDQAGRLVGEAYDRQLDDSPDYIAQYSYDRVGNRREYKISRFPGGNQQAFDDFRAETPVFPDFFDEQTRYVYDHNDRLLEEEFEEFGFVTRTTTYEYGGVNNPATHLTKKTVLDALDNETTNTFEYNRQGGMRSTVIDTNGTDPGGDTTYTYEYNPDGIRVTQTERVGTGAVTTTLYHIDPNNHTGYAQIMEEGVDAGALNGKLDVSEIKKTYTLGHDVIAQTAPSGVTLPDGATANLPLVFLYDGHGSTRMLLNGASDSAVVQRFAFDAYGVALNQSHLTAATDAITTLLYSGEQTDKTGLQYLRARYYDPSTGRFNSLDPFAGDSSDPLSLHKYTYAHNDPISFADPSGQFIFSVLASLLAHLGQVAEEATTGAAVIGILETGGRAGLAARDAGLMLIAQGEFEEGFYLYNLGNRVTGLAFGAIDAVDTAVGVGAGVALTFAAWKLYRHFPEIANAVLDAGRRLRSAINVAESVTDVSSRTISFYHKGELVGGVSTHRELSTGAERASVEALNRPGSVHEFRVPEDLIRRWESEGKVRLLKDYDSETGVYNLEYRFSPSVADELNKYKL